MYILNEYHKETLHPYLTTTPPDARSVPVLYELPTSDKDRFVKACVDSGAGCDIGDNFPDYNNYDQVLHHIVSSAEDNDTLKFSLIQVWRNFCPHKTCRKEKKCICIAKVKLPDYYLLEFISHVLRTDPLQAQKLTLEADKKASRSTPQRPRQRRSRLARRLLLIGASKPTPLKTTSARKERSRLLRNIQERESRPRRLPFEYFFSTCSSEACPGGRQQKNAL